jgi:hypothetical protein
MPWPTHDRSIQPCSADAAIDAETAKLNADMTWIVEAPSRNRLRPYAARSDALSGQPDRARGMRIT